MDLPNTPTRFNFLPKKLPLKKIEALLLQQTVMTDTTKKTHTSLKNQFTHRSARNQKNKKLAFLMRNEVHGITCMHLEGSAIHRCKWIAYLIIYCSYYHNQISYREISVQYSLQDRGLSRQIYLCSLKFLRHTVQQNGRHSDAHICYIIYYTYTFLLLFCIHSGQFFF